jgi:mannose-6-phosphate isomerase-like protein (cupin superfamily)
MLGKIGIGNDLLVQLKMIEKPELHKKAWGSEEWIVNNDEYCAKLLNFNKGARFSMHFHVKKKETWYVTKGKFYLSIINTEDASKGLMELNVGDVFTVDRLVPHQLRAVEEGQIMEVSTQHFEDDSYRVEMGDSQH